MNRKRKLRNYDVVVPQNGVFKTISVSAKSNYLAKVKAGKLLGQITPVSTRSRFVTRYRIKRRKRGGF